MKVSALSSALLKETTAGWFVPFLIASLLLIGFAALDTWRQPYDGLGWSSLTGRINTVESDGPAERAGLLVGDVILSINGIDTADASPPYGQKQVGESVTFGLLRQGKPVQADMVLAAPPLSDLLGRIELSLIALSLWMISIVVLALRPASNEARLFFIVNQVGSAVVATGLLSTSGYETASRAFDVLLCWLSPLILHFHLVFPVMHHSRARSLVLRSYYLLALMLSLPFIIWSIPELRLSQGYLFLYYGARLVFCVALLLSMILLFQNYRFASSQVASRRIRAIWLSSALALIPLGVLSVLQEILEYPVAPYEITFLFLLLIPLSYAYSIYRYNLFETDRILNRGLVALILSIFWSLICLICIGVISRLIPNSTSTSLMAGTLLVLVMVWTLPALQPGLLRLVDHYLYGNGYNYSAVVSHFSQALATTIEESDLASLLVLRLSTIFRIRGAALLVSSEEGEFVPICYKKTTSCPCSTPDKCLTHRLPAVTMLTSGRLASYLLREARPVDSSSLRRALPRRGLDPGDVSLLDSREISVWLPLPFQNKLEAVLLLGPKMADDVYNEEDYRILATLGWQAATTTRNVRLLKELREQLQEIVQSKQDLQDAHTRLLLSREEERKHLAREIHDVPLQELIGLSYRLRDYARQAQGSTLQESLNDLRGEILHVLQELRRICTNLRPPILDTFGLAAAIRTHAIEEVKEGPQIVLHLDEKETLPKDVAISLFRIYQEATTNAIKHAEPTQITVRFEQFPNCCTLSIQDDGKGFVVPSKLERLAQQGHLGLVGMKERAEALGGRLEVISSPQAGTVVRVYAPLQGRKDKWN